MLLLRSYMRVGLFPSVAFPEMPLHLCEHDVSLLLERMSRTCMTLYDRILLHSKSVLPKPEGLGFRDWMRRSQK